MGARADLNVIDLENLTVRRPAVHADLPAGGLRYLQPVSGYVATIAFILYVGCRVVARMRGRRATTA